MGWGAVIRARLMILALILLPATTHGQAPPNTPMNPNPPRSVDDWVQRLRRVRPTTAVLEDPAGVFARLVPTLDVLTPDIVSAKPLPALLLPRPESARIPRSQPDDYRSALHQLSLNRAANLEQLKRITDQLDRLVVLAAEAHALQASLEELAMVEGERHRSMVPTGVDRPAPSFQRLSIDDPGEPPGVWLTLSARAASSVARRVEEQWRLMEFTLLAYDFRNAAIRSPEEWNRVRRSVDDAILAGSRVDYSDSSRRLAKAFAERGRPRPVKAFEDLVGALKTFVLSTSPVRTAVGAEADHQRVLLREEIEQVRPLVVEEQRSLIAIDSEQAAHAAALEDSQAGLRTQVSNCGERLATLDRLDAELSRAHARLSEDHLAVDTLEEETVREESLLGRLMDRLSRADANMPIDAVRDLQSQILQKTTVVGNLRERWLGEGRSMTRRSLALMLGDAAASRLRIQVITEEAALYAQLTDLSVEALRLRTERDRNAARLAGSNADLKALDEAITFIASTEAKAGPQPLTPR
jgi:hypothetical protein